MWDVLGWGLVAGALAAILYAVLRWNRQYRAFRRELEAQGIVFPEPPASLYLIASLFPLALILQVLIFAASHEGSWGVLVLVAIMLPWLFGSWWMAWRTHKKASRRST